MPPSTTLPPRPPVPGADRAAPTLVPGGGRQRRWSLALLAVLVTIGSALAFVVLWMNAGGREPVLALRNNVAAGQVITADDLTVVRVSADSGIDPISSSERDEIVGRPAAATLLAGTLLVPDAIGTDDGLDQGTTVIAIPVPAAELPSDELEQGDRVILYRTPAASSGVVQDTLGEGHVFSVGDDDDGGSDIRVSVTVDESLGLDIATAVSEDQIYLSQAPAD
jgi:SAF domain